MACDHLLVPKGMRLLWVIDCSCGTKLQERKSMTYSPVYEHDLQSSVYVHMCMFDLSIFLESKRLLGIVFEEKYNINIA